MLIDLTDHLTPADMSEQVPLLLTIHLSINQAAALVGGLDESADLLRNSGLPNELVSVLLEGLSEGLAGHDHIGPSVARVQAAAEAAKGAQSA